jgi:hypothetical protein
MIPWPEVYVRIAEGTYNYELIPEHTKYGRCILINNGGEVPTLNPNPNHNKAYIATEIFIHVGFSMSWRGSRGCLTIDPDHEEAFFACFDDHEKGKLILRKAAV